MLTATGSLAQLRPHFTGPARDLFRVLLGATSSTEANLALQVLSETVPEKVLVNACNLREVLGALPHSPFPMPISEETLAKAGGFERGIAAMSKRLPDGLELSLTTAGSLVLDILVRTDDHKFYWNSVPVTEDFVTSEVLELAVESDFLLNAMIDLARDMGVVFNPKFYLSLEDWRMDYACDVFEGLNDLF